MVVGSSSATDWVGVAMIPAFTLFPPEVNSALMFLGAGSGPLLTAASAWDGLASDLAGAAASFNSVVTGLADGAWTGPAALSMAAAAAPYVQWLNTAASQASMASAQARVAATAFETAQASTVLPAAVTANRVQLSTLIATNILGVNLPAIAMTEIEYLEMWAQDVGAMVGYHGGAMSVASVLPTFSLPTLSLGSLGSTVSGAIQGAIASVTNIVPGLSSLGDLSSITSAIPGAVSQVSSLASPLTSVAQVGMMPASMMMSPLMSLAQMGNTSAASLASSAAGVAGDVPKFVGNAVPDVAKGLGGVGGLGDVGAGLGKARLVGAMSVPPTWQGSMPGKMISDAMSGLGGAPNAASMAGAAAPTGGGMPMMPMPMGAGAGGGMPGGALGRGGASPHVVQNRPSVIPRTGVG